MVFKAPVIAGPAAKLIVLKGPKQGAEFNLGPGETSIGRNADNTVVIPDISVSRRHVVLVKQGARYVLQDQGSGNGTLLNGAQVAEQQLNDGDIFNIGDTEIQYVEMGTVAKTSTSSSVPAAKSVRPASGKQPAPARQPSKGQVVRTPPARNEGPEPTGRIVPAHARAQPKAKDKRKLMLGAGGVMVLALVGIGIFKVKKDRAAAAEQAAAEQAAQQKHDDAETAYKEGKELVKQLKFRDAVPKFTAAKEGGADDADLGDYLDRATRETANEQLLDDATAALAKGQLFVANTNILKITPESLLSDSGGAVDDMKKKIKAAVPTRITEAKAKIVTKDFAGAHVILDDISKLDPTNTDANAALDELAKAENKPIPVHKDRIVTATDHSIEVKNAFSAGDIKQAKELASQFGDSDDKVKALGQKIAEFETAYGRMDDDPSAFKKAMNLDQQISGGRSTFTPKLKTRAVAVFLREGASAKSAGDLKKAFKSFEAAHEADPGNNEARSQLEDLKAKAKEMYMEGYVEKGDNPEGARKIFQDVVSMTPSDYDFHIKAQQRLQEMGN